MVCRFPSRGSFLTHEVRLQSPVLTGVFLTTEQPRSLWERLDLSAIFIDHVISPALASETEKNIAFVLLLFNNLHFLGEAPSTRHENWFYYPEVASEACTQSILNNWMACETFCSFRQASPNVMTLTEQSATCQKLGNTLSFILSHSSKEHEMPSCRQVKDGGISFLAHHPRTPASVLWQQSCMIGRRVLVPPLLCITGPLPPGHWLPKPFWLWIISEIH